MLLDLDRGNEAAQLEAFRTKQQRLRLLLFRWIVGLNALLYPVWPKVTGHPLAFDPFWLRMAIAPFFVVAFAYSFLRPAQLTRQMDGLIAALGLAMVGHCFLLGYGNGMDWLFLSCVFATIAALGMLLSTARSMTVLSLGSTVLALMGFWFVSAAETLTLSGLLLSIAVGLILAAVRRERSQRALTGVFAALDHRASEFRRMADTMPVLIWMTDAEGVVTYVNTSGAELIDTEKDTPVGRPFGSPIHPDDREAIVKLFHERRLARQPFEAEYRVRGPGGVYHWVLSRANPAYDEKRVFEGYVGNVVDITARRQAEEDREQLRSRITVTGQLAALGEMAAGIAHEINNPLTIIDALVHQLVRSLDQAVPDPAAAKEYAARIGATSSRIASIVKSMRSLSRRADRDDFEETALIGPVGDALALCSERYRQAGVRLDVDVPKELTLACRAGQLSQVLLNLLANALDAVRREEPKERWVTLAARAQGETVEIAVANGGPRLARELETKVFQPFFTTKPVGQGTGLGLSISRAIVESHGGAIAVDPAAGRTRFVVTLPKEPPDVVSAS